MVRTAHFATGLILGILGAFVYHWSLTEQVTIIVPCSFAIFFLSMLLDRGDMPERARLFRDLATPVNVEEELKDSPDMTSRVFGFLSRTIAAIGLLSLLLWFSTETIECATVLWFAAITLLLSLLLLSIRSPRPAASGGFIAKAERAQ